MAKKEILIRHAFDDIMGCYEDNKFRNPSLQAYYMDDRDRNTLINPVLLEEMKIVIKSRSDNIDPNDSSLMTYIREYLNKVCASNVNDIIDKLKVLNYSTQKHFELLAKELITKAMNDAMAYKNLESNTNDLTTSEICVKISQFFYPFCLAKDVDPADKADKADKADSVKADKSIGVTFGSILGQECSQHFKILTQITKDNNGLYTAFMNKNNQQRINNYRAFMNLVGLLYVANLFPAKIVLSCLTTIKKLVLQSNLSQEECDNYYAGYDRLMMHITIKFGSDKHRTGTSLAEEFRSVIDPITKLNAEINTAIDSMSESQTIEKNNTIRKYSIGIHKLHCKKIQELRAKYERV